MLPGSLETVKVKCSIHTHSQKCGYSVSCPVSEYWPKRTGGSDVEMFEILPRDWNTDFHSKKNVCRHELGWFNPQPPAIPTLVLFRTRSCRNAGLGAANELFIPQRI